MAFFEKPDEGIRKLCRALGIDPDKTPVTKIVLECGIAETLTAHVKIHMTNDAVDVATAIFEKQFAKIGHFTGPDCDLIVDEFGKVKTVPNDAGQVDVARRRSH
jgi:hypothetical protein